MAFLQFGGLHRKAALASRNSSVGSIIITPGDELRSKVPSPEMDCNTAGGIGGSRNSSPE